VCFACAFFADKQQRPANTQTVVKLRNVSMQDADDFLRLQPLRTQHFIEYEVV
jgi:hypothetical protein